MAKNLYRVSVEVELVVVASSTKEAEDLACTLVTCEDGAEPCAIALPCTTRADLPSGWDAGCIPFGDENDREIRDYLGK
jgi:hypothetical protein